MVDEKEIYFNEFDRYIHVDNEEAHMEAPGSDILLSTDPTELKLSPHSISLPSSNLGFDSPLHPQLNDEYASHACGRSSSTHVSPYLLDLPLSSLSNRACPLDMESLCPKKSSPPPGGTMHHSLQENNSCASTAALSTRSEQNDAVFGFDMDAPMASQSSYQILPKDSSQDIACPAIQRQTLRMSELSALVDRLSKCSLGEKSFIKGILKRFSMATVSSMTNSLRSHLSTSSRRSSKSYDFRMPTAPVSSEMSSKRYEVSRAVIGRIFSNGIFWYHMAREMEDRFSFRSRYSKGLRCSVTKYTLSGHERWWYPVPIALDHQGWLIRDIWSESGVPGWLDRFGNTSLHIAAACGAKYCQLQALIIENIDVNALNTARQTFMHVLNPDSLGPEEMVSLRAQLHQKRFKFYQRDVEGRLFLDVLTYRKMDPLDFARCWLQPLIRDMGSTTPYISNYKQVKKIFHESGGDDDQWKILGWAEPPWADHNASGFFGYFPHSNEVLKPPEPESHTLTEGENYTDRSGRGYVDTAAEDNPEPSNPGELQQQTSNGSHLDFVKHLLSVGVDVNGHDETGVTPLMAQLYCVPYQHAIVQELLYSGADTDARERTGETALHIAVKLGNIVATRALLARGANVHTRNRKCEGLLVVAERAQRHAKDDVSLYAKISACMALVIDAGAIASPNLFHEWSLPGSPSH